MKNTKTFDCVRMKWEIQRRLDEESAGLNEDEARRRQDAKVAASPILGPVVARLRARPEQPTGE